MSDGWRTLIFLAGIVSAVVIYDVAAWREWGYDGTISGVIQRAAKCQPAIAAAVGVAVGFVLGHLFWQR